MSKTTLITGANRGIGLEFVKQLASRGDNVIACCRQPENAFELLKLEQQHPTLKIHPLDVTDENSIHNLAKTLKGQPIDWLINNAGISGERGVTIGNVDAQNFLSVLHVNCVGPIEVADALLSNLQAGKEKLVVNITSRMGSISDNTSGKSYAYRASKAALNAVMRSFAIDVNDQGINVMLFHPGWVKTDMGGEAGMVSPEESVKGMLSVIDKHHATSHAEAIWRFDGDTIAW